MVIIGTSPKDRVVEPLSLSNGHENGFGAES